MKILLQGIILLISFSTSAQRYTGKQQRKIVFANKFEISIPPNKSNLQQGIVVQDIEVVDNRFDSTIWGFSKSGKTIKEVISKNNQPVSHSIKEYLSNQLTLDASTNKSLLLVVQQLQFTQNHISDESSGNFNKDKIRWLAGLSLKFEFYLKEERGYSPLYRFDSIIISKEPIDESETIDFIFKNLDLSFAKIIGKDFDSFKPSRFIQRNQILENNGRKFEFPILQDTFYKKGAYRSYTEFKNNKPSITEFEIKTDGRTNTLTVTENGQEYPIRKIWGFSDGNNIYVQSNYNYFQLQRKENSFFTLAAKEYDTKTKINIGKSILSSALVILFPIGTYPIDNTLMVTDVNKYNLSLHPYIVNMETGVLY